jgi:hypothetical protein
MNWLDKSTRTTRSMRERLRVAWRHWREPYHWFDWDGNEWCPSVERRHRHAAVCAASNGGECDLGCGDVGPFITLELHRRCEERA